MRNVEKIIISLFLVIFVTLLVVSCNKKADDSVIEIRAEKIDETPVVEELVVDNTEPVVEVVEEPEVAVAEEVPEVEVLPEETVEEEVVEEPVAVAEVSDEISDEVIDEVAEDVTEEVAEAEETEKVEEIEETFEEYKASITNYDYDSDADFGSDEYDFEVLDANLSSFAEAEEVVSVEPEEPEVVEDTAVEDVVDYAAEVEKGEDEKISFTLFGVNDTEEPVAVEEFEEIEEDEEVEEVAVEEPLFTLFATDSTPEEKIEEDEVFDEETVEEEEVFVLDETWEDLPIVDKKSRKFGVQFGFGAQFTKFNYYGFNVNVMKYSVPISFNFPCGKAMTLSAYLRPAYFNVTDHEKNSRKLEDSFSFATGVGVGVMTKNRFEAKFNLGAEFINKGTAIVKDPCGMLNMAILPSVRLGKTNLWLTLPIESSFSFGENFNSEFSSGLYFTYRSGEGK